MRLVRGWRLVGLLFVGTVLVLGFVLPLYWTYLLTAVAVSALIARSIGLVTNQSGLITLCQMSFAAIGGWVVSWLALTTPDLPYPVLLVAGALTAGAVGLLIGIATVRIRGIEFAVVTLGFAAALDLILRQGSFPGVGSGTPVIPAAPFNDPRVYFALAWAALLLVQLVLSVVGRTAPGIAWSAIRGSERATAALGVKVGTARTTAVAAGALIAGLAGGLLAGQYGLLTPQVFSPLTSMVYLATAVLCGASLFSGAVLAGVVTVFVPELLRRIGLPLDVANALLAIGAVDVLRRGHGGIAEQLQHRLQERPFRNSRLSCELPPLDNPDVAASLTKVLCLEVTGLTVTVDGNRILDGVDLKVQSGTVHALIGPNGAGKTTLVDAISGFLPQYGGRILLEGEPLEGLTVPRRVKRGMRRTFQHPRGMEALTVDEYLRLSVDPARSDRTTQVRDFFGLPDGAVPVRLMDARSRRILEIAGALVSDPRVVLVDEPAAGLDESESRELAERLRHVPAHFDSAILLIEHDMAFVRTASTDTTLLDQGHVIGTGKTTDMLNDSRTALAYLGTGAPR